MYKVKLEMKQKTDLQLRAFGTKHKVAITGNINFPAPSPLPAVFDPALSAYGNKLDAIAAAEDALSALRVEKETLRTALEAVLTARANYVELTVGNDAAKILSAGFDVRADAVPTSSLHFPQSLVATLGDNEGEAYVAWHSVKKAKSYIIEAREHSETAAPGAWHQVKVVSRSSATITGLVSGKKYAFRVRALGPKDLESPWSDEAVCMAA